MKFILFLIIKLIFSKYPYPKDIDTSRKYFSQDFPIFNLTYTEELTFAPDVVPFENH